MSYVTIILAAGKGKRMASDLPKVLLSVGSHSMIYYVVKNAILSGSEKIIIVVGYKKELVIEEIRNNFEKEMSMISFVTQNEQLGTGHAVMQTRDELDNYSKDVLILYGDMPLIKVETIKKLVNRHTAENADMTLLTVQGDRPIEGFGRILRDFDGNLVRIVEQKDATEVEKNIAEVNPSIFLFKKDSLFLALGQISNKNAQKEYYLTDCLEILIKHGKKISSFISKDVDEVCGANTPQDLEHIKSLI